MSLISIEFIAFVIMGLILYYVLPKKIQWVVLLLLSYAFYIAGGVSAMLFLLITTATTYVSGIVLGKYNKSEKNEKTKKKLILGGTILLNFGILFLFKYYNYVLDFINAIVPFEKAQKFDLILPLGISFYIFQSIGYLIDVYRKKYEPEKNIFKYALFIAFFPQMIQGPISRFDYLEKQLLEERKFSFDNMKSGIQLLMWGYFKKLVIADRAAIVVNSVIPSYENYAGSVILISIILYSIQLYCDFSGGIDIIRRNF